MILGTSKCSLNNLVGNGNNTAVDRFVKSAVRHFEKKKVSSDERKSEKEAVRSSEILDPNCTDSNRSHLYAMVDEHNLDMPKQSLIKDLPEYISFHLIATADDNSVSSLGSDEENSEGLSCGGNRSIFRDYWNTGTDEKDMNSSSPGSGRRSKDSTATDQQPTSPQHEVPRKISLDWSSYHQDYEEALSNKAASDPHGYEDYLKMNEAGRTVMPSAALLNVAKNNCANHLMTRNPLASPASIGPSLSRSISTVRREIFTYKYTFKSPTLPSYEYKYKQTKSAQPSTLYNSKRMLRSSLRRDRSSSISESLPTMEDSLLSHSTRRSVTFDTHVSVHEYSKPCESYIHDGWSNFFY